MNEIKLQPAYANLVFSWVWILFGTVSGMLLGLRFQEPNWLGGYASFPRRLYRLGHISFFGLGLVNFLFALTALYLPLPGPVFESRLLIISAVSMPIVCVCMAHTRKAHPFFAIPVGTLICGIVSLLLKLL